MYNKLNKLPVTVSIETAVPRIYFYKPKNEYHLRYYDKK